MPKLSLRDVVAVLYGDPNHVPAPAEIEEIAEVIGRHEENPAEVIAELFRARGRAAKAEHNCARAAEAATNLEGILKGLLDGNATYYRLEAIRRTAEGSALAVCHVGNLLREFPVHPNLDVSLLEALEPWEYVRVREDVAVGVWAGEPSLLAAAQGSVVSFKAICDDSQGLVQVQQDGHGEWIARLARHLRRLTLTPASRLVLLRDDPRWAIGLLPSLATQSRFELPVGQIKTRLEDLAGIEPIARRLIEDVLVHVIYPAVRKEFNLKPMHGFLLSSCQPGMAKTALMRAFGVWLVELGEQGDFEVVLYAVPPNALKNLFHGEDARIVREDLFGAIQARRQIPRNRPLIQYVMFDEVDSLGRRADANIMITSSAQSDALEALLAEIDGVVQQQVTDGPPSYLILGGTTNLPERVDEALKRPGRLGDLILEMPRIDIEVAEDIMAIYGRGPLAWYWGGGIRRDVDEDFIRTQFLRPALAAVFPTTVLHYTTDQQKRIAVSAGEILAGVHYEQAMNEAKKRAALRRIREIGVPAIAFDDIVECLLNSAADVAEQMQADRNMLVRQLQLKLNPVSAEAVDRRQLQEHRYLRLHA
jgi:ATP-dependent 26S proteasome regulatory subunit